MKQASYKYKEMPYGKQFSAVLYPVHTGIHLKIQEFFGPLIMKTFIVFCAALLAVSASPFSFQFGQDVPQHSPGYGWSSSAYHYPPTEAPAPMHPHTLEKPLGTQTVESIPAQTHPSSSGHTGSGHIPGGTTPGYPAVATAPPNTTVLPPTAQVQTQIEPSATSPEHKPTPEASVHPNATSASGYGTQHVPAAPGTYIAAAPAQAPAAASYPGATEISGHGIAHNGIRDDRVYEHINAYMRAIQDHLDAHEKAHNGKADASAHFRATKKAAEDHASAVHAIAASHRRTRVGQSPPRGASVAVPSVATATTSFYY